MNVLSVSECLRQLNSVLQTQVVTVEGEVQGFRISQGRWGFFSLKDENGIIECFMMAFRIRIPFEDGMTIRVLATPGIHQKSGRFRLIVENVEVVGEGALKRAFELLRRQLEAEGLFAEARKRTVTRFPRAIGLVASQDSAAYSDFLKVLQARFGGITVYVANVAVQGERAVPEVIAALDQFSHFSEPLDAVVITRGGGSMEDLMAFNDEALARAIFRCPLPVVSAIGHERDVTIADYVADIRASTPSNAAELLVPHRREVEGELMATARRLESALGRRAMLAAHDLDRVTHYFVGIVEQQNHAVRVTMQRFLGAAQTVIAKQRQAAGTLTEYERRLTLGMARSFRETGEALRAMRQRLESLNPERLLARGYSIVRRQGRVVKSRRELAVHDAVEITLSDGSAAAEIISTS